MKNRVLLIAICLLCALGFTACTGYNNIMYEYLSDADHYKTYEVVIEQIYVSNKETGKREQYDETVHDESYLNGTVIFCVSKIEGFEGDDIWLEVIPENSQLLAGNGFYDGFSVGSTIKIEASNWVYMDTNFYYIIGLEYEGVQYLDEEDGLKNIVDMMDNDRSLI